MENLPSLNENNSTPFNYESLKLKFSQKKINFIFGGIIILIILTFFFFFNAPNNFPSGVIVNIKDGASLRSISKSLKNNNIIKSRAVFETLVIIFEGERYIASGDYLFENRLSVFEIARRISKGERHLAPIKVTIPEGFNISEISEVFKQKLVNFNETGFVIEAKNKEGFLFPDTYFFLTTANEQNVINSMNENYKKKIMPFKSKIISSGKTEKEIMTMASLIEEESKGDTDRKIISGILWKRLSIGMALQVDAEPSTYKTRGLPQAPISNPGIKSIEASLYPENTKYLYYLHDKDGNAHYAVTFTEHKLNKQKYLK